MSSLTHVVGWTLIHFIWQGAVLAVTAAGALRLCRHRSANARYITACLVLAAMLVSPLITARVLMTPDLTVAPALGLRQILAAPRIVSTAPHSWTNDGVPSIDAVSAGVNASLAVIVFVWLGGVAILLARMAGGLWHVRRLQIRSLAAGPSRWQASTERIASRLGLRVAVHVVESALIDVPAAIGWLRPVILLPIAALANLTPSQIEAILAHELIHIRRHDYLVNVAQTVAETLLFFHPGVWWVSGQVRAEREHCCDDVAVEVCGDPVDYAAALAELEEGRSRGTTLALAAIDGSLTGRVRRVLKVPIGHEARSLSWVVTLGLACASAVVMGGIYASPRGSRLGVPVLLARGAQGVEPITPPDTFDWHVHTTSHFDIHYYPALTPNLEQVADSAERGYQRISSELQYNVPFRVPLILFKTRSDFAQQSIAPEANEAISRGQVNAFSEPRRNRVVILIEEQRDRLSRLVTHELTHIFAFDIIPRSPTNIRRVPPWIDEGLAEYMTGVWDPDALRQMRDLVVADSVPKVTLLAGDLDAQPRGMTANLGHAVFEFIEAEYGKPAVWQFLLEVRRSVIDGVPDLYQAAFNRAPEEFDSAFAEYLRRRFIP
jgi:beta-lactamase regulating signal transducer with metallopeptidase domain